MNALDTNVWLYCHDHRDARKQQRALELVKTVRPLALPWQVGCEFMAASRKLRPAGWTEKQAWDALSKMQRLVNVILLPDVTLWPAACTLQEQHGLSFWDALLAAACIRGGVSTLFTEDFGTLPSVGPLAIVNPFNG